MHQPERPVSWSSAEVSLWPMKKRYKVVVASCVSALEEKVNQLLDEGWELQGGVSNSSHGYETTDSITGSCEDYTYCQALTNHE